MSIHQIYFLQRADGLIKIGTTVEFASRLAALTTSHGMLAVLRLINGGRKREQALHRQFRRFHEYGEWFRSERGELQSLIEQLDEGPEIAVGATEAQTEWDLGEAALMVIARQKIDGMIKARMDRTMVKREAAMKAIAEEYGFSPWFLWHARKRGSTVSAFGYQRIREAHLAELQALAAQLVSEIRAEGDTETADRLRAIAAEIEAKRARVG